MQSIYTHTRYSRGRERSWMVYRDRRQQPHACSGGREHPWTWTCMKRTRRRRSHACYHWHWAREWKAKGGRARRWAWFGLCADRHALIPVGQSHHPSHCRTQSTHLTYVQYWIEIGVDPWMSSSMTMIIHGWCWCWCRTVWALGLGRSGGANAGQRWKTCRCPRKRRHRGSAS
jgi:hypothetical protein